MNALSALVLALPVLVQPASALGYGDSDELTNTGIVVAGMINSNSKLSGSLERTEWVEIGKYCVQLPPYSAPPSHRLGLLVVNQKKELKLAVVSSGLGDSFDVLDAQLIKCPSPY